MPVAGAAVDTAEPVGEARPVPDHVYVLAPLAVKLRVGPTQNGALELTVKVVGAGATTFTVLVIVVPHKVLVIVTE